MKILSIDQSFTSSGCVVMSDGNIIYSDIFRTSKEVDTFKRAALVADHVLELANKYKPDVVAIEGLAFGMRGNSTRDLAGLQFAIIIELQVRNGYVVEIVAPLTVKKFATGSGKAKKLELFSALPEKTKKYLKEDMGYLKTKGLYDATDAIWIGKVVDSKHNNKVDKKVNK